MEQIIKNLKEEIKQEIFHYRVTLSQIQGNEFSLGAISEIKVEYFGTLVPLNTISAIHRNGAHQIIIKPYDKKSLKLIAKGIEISKLRTTLNNDGHNIFLTLPELTTENKHQIIKQVKEITSSSQIKIRQIRHKYLHTLTVEKEQWTKDDVFSLKKEIQVQVDEGIKKILEIDEAKAKQIMN